MTQDDSAQPTTSRLPYAIFTDRQGLRILSMGGQDFTMGAMCIEDPLKIALGYTRWLMAWLLWRPEREMASGHVVQLGLGAGSIVRFCHGVMGMRATAVEINPAVIQICRMWFHLKAEEGGVAIVKDDARRWVDDPVNEQTVDALCVDLYDHMAAAPVLDDVPFYEACRRVLREGGAMTVNLFGEDSSFAGTASKIARAFGADRVWSLQQPGVDNTVLVATRGVECPAPGVLATRAAYIRSTFGLEAEEWLGLLKPLTAVPESSRSA